MTDKVEKEEKIEEYNQILELFGEKVEEIDFEDVKSVYIRNSVFTDNAKKVENMTSEEKAKPLSRRKLREEAFKIIFSMEFLEVDDDKVDIYCNINGIGNNEDIIYLKNIVDIYNNNNKYLENIIKDNKKETWEYGRIDKSSIALIKLAIIEIEYLNMPYKIVINECINICKKYSEEKNTKFINGILANYIKIKGIKQMEVKVFTVTEFSNLVKVTIEERKELETICVKGEVSNFKLNTSGHLYFTLKDESATVKCIMFKNYALKNNIDIKDGDKIFVLRKNYSIWWTAGYYQIQAVAIKKDGVRRAT